MNSENNRRLKKIFAETLGIADVPDDISQKNCAAWDSISHLNLIIAIEAEFGIVFEPEEIAAAQNFSSLSALVDKKA